MQNSNKSSIMYNWVLNDPSKILTPANGHSFDYTKQYAQMTLQNFIKETQLMDSPYFRISNKYTIHYTWFEIWSFGMVDEAETFETLMIVKLFPG